MNKEILETLKKLEQLAINENLTAKVKPILVNELQRNVNVLLEGNILGVELDVSKYDWRDKYEQCIKKHIESTAFSGIIDLDEIENLLSDHREITRLERQHRKILELFQE